MKSELKSLILWMASLSLFICAGLAIWMAMDVMVGVSGLTIRFFLGYCGIIIVSQLFSALSAVGQLVRDITETRPVSNRTLLR